ncbi:secondary thiamine-phosphate synthase enzyme YjbQ [Chloroflexota bacterium]
MVERRSIRIDTRGNCDIIDITQQVFQEINISGIDSGIVTVFAVGSTGGITTIEYEPGLVSDLKTMWDRLVPVNIDYRHNLAWGDGNGHAHVRSSLVGASLTVPFTKKIMSLGTWQQIVFVDFDNRPRSREIVLQIIGE